MASVYNPPVAYVPPDSPPTVSFWDRISGLQVPALAGSWVAALSRLGRPLPPFRLPQENLDAATAWNQANIKPWLAPEIQAGNLDAGFTKFVAFWQWVLYTPLERPELVTGALDLTTYMAFRTFIQRYLDPRSGRALRGTAWEQNLARMFSLVFPLPVAVGANTVACGWFDGTGRPRGWLGAGSVCAPNSAAACAYVCPPSGAADPWGGHFARLGVKTAAIGRAAPDLAAYLSQAVAAMHNGYTAAMRELGRIQGSQEMVRATQAAIEAEARREAQEVSTRRWVTSKVTATAADPLKIHGGTYTDLLGRQRTFTTAAGERLRREQMESEREGKTSGLGYMIGAVALVGLFVFLTAKPKKA